MLKLGEKFGETLYLLAFEIANNWVQKNGPLRKDYKVTIEIYSCSDGGLSPAQYEKRVKTSMQLKQVGSPTTVKRVVYNRIPVNQQH
jgi:hypothetical protein